MRKKSQNKIKTNKQTKNTQKQKIQTKKIQKKREKTNKHTNRSKQKWLLSRKRIQTKSHIQHFVYIIIS